MNITKLFPVQTFPSYIETDEGGKKSEACMEMIDQKIKDNLNEMNITKLFPVQTSLIPAILEGCRYGLGEVNYPPSDLCCSAATGSGKTLAFAIPIVHVCFICFSNLMLT